MELEAITIRRKYFADVLFHKEELVIHRRHFVEHRNFSPRAKALNQTSLGVGGKFAHLVIGFRPPGDFIDSEVR